MIKPKNKMDRGTLRRGFIDAETPEKYKHLTYMSLTTKKQHLTQIVEKKRSEMKSLYKKMNNPKKVNLRKHRENPHLHKKYGKTLPLYFKIGKEINDLNTQLNELRKYIKKFSPSFTEKFIDVAENMLSEKVFEEIKRETIKELDKIYDQVD
ncbi:MAG: hypothetical protein GY870_04625 [archaeon]|nr:hypothetical protein [archaeon]